MEASAELQYHKIRELSASSRQTFAACPRKSQLAKFSSGRGEDTIHTVFGKAVGAGLQTWFGDRTVVPQHVVDSVGKDSSALLAVFASWTIPLWDVNIKADKSLGMAVYMVEKFIADCTYGELPFNDSWEFIGAEVGFKLLLPGGFKYRGKLDLLLRSPEGIPAVIEVKTSGTTVSSSADWQNAEQGNGYSLVLPAILPNENSQRYMLYYLVGMTRLKKWIEYPFVKTAQHKLDFLQDLLAETRVIEFYESLPRFPMRGTACSAWGRQCNWLDLCHLPTEKLVNFSDIRLDSADDFPITVDLMESL